MGLDLVVDAPITEPVETVKDETGRATPLRLGAHSVVIDGKDVFGGAMPLSINCDTAGMTYGANTYGRCIRLHNTNPDVFWDFAIDADGSLTIRCGFKTGPAAPYHEQVVARFAIPK